MNVAFHGIDQSRDTAILFLRTEFRAAEQKARLARERAARAAEAAEAADRRANRLQAALEEVQTVDDGDVASSPQTELSAAGSDQRTPTAMANLPRRAHVLKAIKAAPVEFSSDDIIEWLGSNAPAMTGGFGRDYVYSILWKLTNGDDACLRVVARRGKGQLTRYRRLREP